MTTELPTCISLTRRLYSQPLEPVCEHCGITHVELDILSFPHNHPGYNTVTDIIKIRHLTKSHVSSFIKTLEEQGYLEKFCRSNNGKTIHLKITNKAAEILAGGLKAQKTLSNLVLQDFSDKQIVSTEKSLKRLTDDVQTMLTEGEKHGL